MPDPSFRRRRILVDQSFQWSLCAHGLLLGVFLLVAVCCGLFAPLLWDLGATAPNQPADADLAIVMVYMHERFWSVAGACLLLVALAALQLSHRIAGPLVRYKRHLRLLAQGKLPPPLRTRRHDYLKEEVACLNAAVAGLRERLAAVRDAAAELQQQVALVCHAAPAVAAAALPALTAAERRLQQSLQGLGDATAQDEAALAADPVATAPALATATAVVQEA